MDHPQPTLTLPFAALEPHWWFSLPLVVWTVWVFLLGLGIGSFLNVLIARLPFEKSVLWPGSRCFACLRPIRFADNLPIVGYLRLRGRCRFCRSRFSSRYLWVELGTALAFVGLYWIEIVANWHDIDPFARIGAAIPAAVPPLSAWLYFAAHAYLLAMLIAAAVIDIDYKIIPTQITYVGTLVGLGVSVLFPWPWPNAPAAVSVTPTAAPWDFSPLNLTLPSGVALWPVWHPLDWAPPGSWQLGLLTGVAGALAGMFVIRALKFVFEYGFGQEALGLGDADLLMMAGAFLGWQPVVLAVPTGAFVTLGVLPLVWLWVTLRRRPFPRHIPFGPGLAAGVLVCWLGWPVISETEPLRTVFFEPTILIVGTVLLLGLLLIAGLLLRR
jgi:leader peptidase (prepilin peptidase)/N-methyltransferase